MTPAVSAAVLSLERVARERITEVCDRAFERTFETDPAVFVIRKVHCRVAVLASRTTLESQLAERLGARLCSSVVRVIADNSDQENVVRFENQAEFVSGFLSDFVAGTVWDHWYHSAFRPYRDLPADQAILAVLIENLDCLGQILRRLQKANTLVAVLAALGPDGQRRLWLHAATHSSEQGSENAARIFVQTAFHLIDSLALWASSRPSEPDCLRDYLFSQPASPQWTDPSSLASAVFEVLRFLARRGSLLLPRSLGADDLNKLDAVLNSSCDWLDTSLLKKSFLALVASVPPQSSSCATTLRPCVLTPAQLRLLSALLLSVREGLCPLDPAEVNPHSHLLRLLAGLATAQPSANFAQLPVLESIVEAWLALRNSVQRNIDVVNLRRGQLNSILINVSSFDKNRLLTHLRSVANAGEPAIVLVEELLKRSPSKPSAVALEHLHSNCAGLFLLVRTVQDLRLSALLKDSGFSSLEPLLVALCLRIGGPSALQNGNLDPGAARWSGITAEAFPNHLSQLATLDTIHFRNSLSELLAAQCLIDSIPGPEFTEHSPVLDLPTELSKLIDFTAASLLHTWARWLPGLSRSSVSFLLEKFIFRGGTLHLYPDRIDVVLSHGTLDAILKMAGYLSDSPPIPWLANRLIRFCVAS